MAKKKKKQRGEISFVKSMVVLGMIVAGFFIHAFFDSAPSLSNRPYHKTEAKKEQCMACHVANIKNAPIMPHRPMDGCTFCHEPLKENLSNK